MYFELFILSCIYISTVMTITGEMLNNACQKVPNSIAVDGACQRQITNITMLIVVDVFNRSEGASEMARMSENAQILTSISKLFGNSQDGHQQIHGDVQVSLLGFNPEATSNRVHRWWQQDGMTGDNFEPFSGVNLSATIEMLTFADDSRYVNSSSLFDNYTYWAVTDPLNNHLETNKDKFIVLISEADDIPMGSSNNSTTIQSLITSGRIENPGRPSYWKNWKFVAISNNTSENFTWLDNSTVALRTGSSVASDLYDTVISLSEKCKSTLKCNVTSIVDKCVYNTSLDTCDREVNATYQAVLDATCNRLQSAAKNDFELVCGDNKEEVVFFESNSSNCISQCDRNCSVKLNMRRCYHYQGECHSDVHCSNITVISTRVSGRPCSTKLDMIIEECAKNNTKIIKHQNNCPCTTPLTSSTTYKTTQPAKNNSAKIFLAIPRGKHDEH